jgi:hypothetical protein
MKRTRHIGIGLLGALMLTALAGLAQPAAADVEVYFNPPTFYFGAPTYYSPPTYYAPAPPAPWGWHRWEPGYYYDRGQYYRDGGQWRHDGYGWRHEQGYWRR